MNKISNIIWGILFIVVGVIVALNSFNVVKINVFFDGWWTLFIIVPCFIDLFKNEDKTGNIIGIIIGVFLLLACRDILNFEIIWKMIIPVILVIIGVSLIFKDTLKKEVKEKINSLNKKGKGKEYCATFSGQNLNFANEDFKGCDLTSGFGGIKGDLRNANLNKECVINISAIFGGITLLVPSNVNVKVVSTSIFGGVDGKNKYKKDNEITIYVNATCLFGGVDIR